MNLKRKLLAGAALAGCLLFTCCSEPTAPDYSVEGVTSFEPLPIYTEWYAELEECADQTRPFENIEWYTATEIYADGKLYGGLWVRPNQIYLFPDLIDKRWAVDHEALHYLIQSEEEPPVFDRCVEKQPGSP